jgi:Asp-tRNA(Asn)/Glu-tRNA(Gln) amidotransferase A subunit family amidase
MTKDSLIKRRGATMTETTWLDATAQAELVRRGEISAADLVEAAIARIEAVNPQAAPWSDRYSPVHAGRT